MKATLDISDQLIFEAMKLSSTTELDEIINEALDHYVQVAKLPQTKIGAMDFGSDYFVDPCECGK